MHDSPAPTSPVPLGAIPDRRIFFFRESLRDQPVLKMSKLKVQFSHRCLPPVRRKSTGRAVAPAAIALLPPMGWGLPWP